MKTTKKNVRRKTKNQLPGVFCNYVMLREVKFTPYHHYGDEDGWGEIDEDDYNDAIGGTTPYYAEELTDTPYGDIVNFYRMSFRVFSRFTEKNLSSSLDVEIFVGVEYKYYNFYPLQHFRATFDASLIFDRPVSGKEEKELLAIQSLSILWPHAREFAADILRRAGYKPALLPVIDPVASFEAGLIHIWDGDKPTKSE